MSCLWYVASEVRALYDQSFHVLRLEGKVLGEARFVTEWAEQGSLEEVLHKDISSDWLSLGQALQFATDIAHAVAWLHEDPDGPVLHRDIKSANVLVTRHTSQNGHYLRARLADFDLCIYNDALPPCNSMQKAGTKTHSAPEVWQSPSWLSSEVSCDQLSDQKEDSPWPCKVGTWSDVYSLGCVLTELFALRYPWSHCAQQQATLRGGTELVLNLAKLRRNVHLRHAPPESLHLSPSLDLPDMADFTSELQSLVRQCTAFDLHQRPSARELVKRLSVLSKAAHDSGWSQLKLRRCSCSQLILSEPCPDHTGAHS